MFFPQPQTDWNCDHLTYNMSINEHVNTSVTHVKQDDDTPHKPYSVYLNLSPIRIRRVRFQMVYFNKDSAVTIKRETLLPVIGKQTVKI